METNSLTKQTRTMKVKPLPSLRKTTTLFILIFTVILFMNRVALGQAASASWALTSNSNSSVSGNVTSTSQTGGSGIGTMSYGSTGVSANSWNTTSQDATAYYQFTISPAAGNNLTVTAINLINSVSAQVTTLNGLIQYSLNSSFTSPVNVVSFNPTTTQTSVGSSSLSILVPDGQTLYVRVYAWSFLTSSTTFRVRNVVISGSTVLSCVAPSAPTATSDYFCTGTSATLTASGAASGEVYKWYDAATVGNLLKTSTDNTDNTYLPTPAGTTSYWVSIFKATGCESSRTEVTATLSSPLATVTGTTNITCYDAADGTITISASGGQSPYTFSVNNGGTYLEATSGDTHTFTGLAANTPYKIRVKDANGCESPIIP